MICSSPLPVFIFCKADFGRTQIVADVTQKDYSICNLFYYLFLFFQIFWLDFQHFYICTDCPDCLNYRIVQVSRDFCTFLILNCEYKAFVFFVQVLLIFFRLQGDDEDDCHCKKNE